MHPPEGDSRHDTSEVAATWLHVAAGARKPHRPARHGPPTATIRKSDHAWGVLYAHRLACVRAFRGAVREMLADPEMTRSRCVGRSTKSPRDSWSKVSEPR